MALLSIEEMTADSAFSAGNGNPKAPGHLANPKLLISSGILMCILTSCHAADVVWPGLPNMLHQYPALMTMHSWMHIVSFVSADAIAIATLAGSS